MTHPDPFCILSLRDYEAEPTAGKGMTYRIHLPVREELKWIHDHESLKKRHANGNILWLSGGGAYVINQEWVPLVQRTFFSPTNPGKLTLSTGRAESLEELLHPQKIIRELFEEIVLFQDNETPLIPDLGEDFCCESSMRRCLELAHISFRRFQKIPARLDPSLQPDCVEVYDGGTLKSKTRGLIHHDRESGEFNLLFAVHLKIEMALIPSIIFRDTECIPLHGQLSPANRNVFLYHLPTESIYTCGPNKHLKVERETPSITNHALLMLQKLQGAC